MFKNYTGQETLEKDIQNAAKIAEIKNLCKELSIECFELDRYTSNEDTPYDEWEEGRLTGMMCVLNQLKLILDEK